MLYYFMETSNFINRNSSERRNGDRRQNSVAVNHDRRCGDRRSGIDRRAVS